MDPTCSVGKAKAWAEGLCVGKESCMLEPFPTLGDPCAGQIKRLVLQAQCSGTKGGPAEQHSAHAPSVMALGAIGGSGGAQKVLVINSANQETEVSFTGFGNTDLELKI